VNESGAAGSQLAALIMLVAYTATALVILPREINFLRSVEQPEKGRFITLDVLIQVFMLLVLLPPAFSALNSLAGFVILGVGFVGLWVVVIWTAVARYRYVHRFLASQQDKLKQEFIGLNPEQADKEKSVE